MTIIIKSFSDFLHMSVFVFMILMKIQCFFALKFGMCAFLKFFLEALFLIGEILKIIKDSLQANLYLPSQKNGILNNSLTFTRKRIRAGILGNRILPENSAGLMRASCPGLVRLR